MHKRILVVDDHLDQATSLGLLLKLMGHEVQLASDGLSALEAAAKYLPDVALIDIGIPRLDGYEVARRIRAMPALKHIVLVAQTGWGLDEHRRQSKAAGFDHHLMKPVDITALRRILAALPPSPSAEPDLNA